MDEFFDSYDQAVLRIAEDEAPWGEAAENLRMLYLAAVTAMSTCADKDAAKRLQARIGDLHAKLFGRPPEREPFRVRSLLRD